jgi:DNA-binding IscR family transcriptional regulator
MRATEGNLDLVFCVGHNRKATKSCERAVQCVARDVWLAASKRLMEYLDSVTLQDLCKEAQERGVERVIDKHLMYYI